MSCDDLNAKEKFLSRNVASSNCLKTPSFEHMDFFHLRYFKIGNFFRLFRNDDGNPAHWACPVMFYSFTCSYTSNKQCHPVTSARHPTTKNTNKQKNKQKHKYNNNHQTTTWTTKHVKNIWRWCNVLQGGVFLLVINAKKKKKTCSGW